MFASITSVAIFTTPVSSTSTTSSRLEATAPEEPYQRATPVTPTPLATATPDPTPTIGPTSPAPIWPDVDWDLVTLPPTLQEITEQVLDQDPPDAQLHLTVSRGYVSAAHNGTAPLPSASAAKAYWVAAAVAAVGVEAVEPYAKAVFTYSDNTAAGSVIDLIGIDAVNDYTADLGMTDTYLASWSYERRRTASDRGIDGMPTANQTTTNDAVTFLRALHSGDALDEAGTAAVLEWMTLSPSDLDTARTGWGGVLVDELGQAQREATAHKAGWLPPGCCSSIRSVIIALGIIPTDTGPLFIALAAKDGTSYRADAAWISRVAATFATAPIQR